MTGEVFRILLVEDNEADVYLFRKALQSAGLEFELIVMDDGGKAIEFVRGEGEHAGRAIPDLAVIDLSLPKNDGVQVLEAIRADERFACTPVIVTSSSAMRLPASMNATCRLLAISRSRPTWKSSCRSVRP